MDTETLKLTSAPIIEAVLDIECDLPPGSDIEIFEKSAIALFEDRYPKLQTVFMQEHRIETKLQTPPQVSTQRSVQAFRFLQNDGKQLVQVRPQGFSFNRLAPYSTLDEYLPEMKRTWGLFAKLVSPVQVRRLRLRYINRISLPLSVGTIGLDAYIKNAPSLPPEENLKLVGFLDQRAAVEMDTGNRVNTILAAQPPEGNSFPILFDITVENANYCDPAEWTEIEKGIQLLRRLKNRIFTSTLTEKCLNLFQA